MQELCFPEKGTPSFVEGEPGGVTPRDSKHPLKTDT